MIRGCQYVRNHYSVPAEIGRRVVVYGEAGIIAADRGNYIGVTLDKDKPGTIRNYHPTDGVTYGEMGKIRKRSRSQERYQRFLDAESGWSFKEWLQYEKWERQQTTY